MYPPRVFLIPAAFCLLIPPSPVMAYIGPGSGLAAIGSLLALLAAAVLALIGFVWFPLKRLVRKRRSGSGAQIPADRAGETMNDDGTPTRPVSPLRGFRSKFALGKVPLLLFVLTITLTAFAYGNLVEKYRIFPYSVIANGVVTGKIMIHALRERDTGRFREFSEVPLEQAAARRIGFPEGGELDDPVLWYGGLHQFLDLCPGDGCLAVEYTAAGEVAHAWPLRLHELEQAAIAGSDDDFPYEFSSAFDFREDIHTPGIVRYPNGDLLVTFHFWDAFPYTGGVARIDRDGHPVWFRRDYSHHWPYMQEDGIALVPGMLLGDETWSLESGVETIAFDCPRGASYIDTISFIDGDGHLLKSINLLDAFIGSPYVRFLQHELLAPEGPCDLLHLNFIHRVGENTGGAWGMEPGDLVLSFRNLNAFAILGRESDRIKRVIRGSFSRQHNVRHLEGSAFLMFDNHGSDGIYGPSRLLMIDVSDGRETTIFPNDGTPEELRGLFTDVHGNMDISRDGKRAIVVFDEMGTAVEVRLSDGEVLNVFSNLHDVSGREQFGDERHSRAAMFELRGIDYTRPTAETP